MTLMSPAATYGASTPGSRWEGRDAIGDELVEESVIKGDYGT